MGQHVKAMGDSNWSWVGLLAGKKEDILMDIKSIRINTDKGWKNPIFAEI